MLNGVAYLWSQSIQQVNAQLRHECATSGGQLWVMTTLLVQVTLHLQANGVYVTMP